MDFEEIKNALTALTDDELRELEVLLRRILEPHPSSLTPVEDDDHQGYVTYRLKYFRCGTSGCRCRRGFLHGPYLFATHHFADGGSRQRYIGRVAVERPDIPRQLELELK